MGDAQVYVLVRDDTSDGPEAVKVTSRWEAWDVVKDLDAACADGKHIIRHILRGGEEAVPNAVKALTRGQSVCFEYLDGRYAENDDHAAQVDFTILVALT